MNLIRSSGNQPSYNLESASNAGGSPTNSHALTHESSKENLAPPDAEEYEIQRRAIEDLKAEISDLRYTLNTVNGDHEIKQLQFQNELRKAKELADEEFKKKQAAESDKNATARQSERLQEELEELRAKQDEEKAQLERRVRAAEDEARLLREEAEDLRAAKDDAARLEERKVADLQAQIQTARNEVAQLEQDAETREEALQQAQAQVKSTEDTISNMEAEILRLKAQTGDADTMAIIRRELSEQVAHIRNLEATNREQLNELRRLRANHKAVEIVEEEKASLQRKLETAEEVKAELALEQRQRERLEAERLAWAAYLEREGQADFDSPEAVARALVQERFNAASLLEKIGSIQAQLADRDATIQALEEEKANLSNEVEKAKTTNSASASGSSEKARLRVERQRALAEKEVKLLREQLKMYESEDITLQPDKYDEKKAQRVQELEALVDTYKDEVKALEAQVSAMGLSSNSPASIAGTKRPASSDGESLQNEQVGQLARKNRTLQDEIDSLKTKYKVLETELSVAREQLNAVKQSSSVRVLELRSNPTATHQAVKQATIDELRTENEHLRSLIHDGNMSSFQSVPVSTLVALQRDLQSARDETASWKKKCQRLKEVWSDKSAEFKEAVFALLGWHVTFIPTNKMRVESVYYPSETDEHERSITFDGERGSMKCGGGPKSEFAMKISDLVKYWVREKNCIPGFLAALTLELYEQAVQEGRE